MPLFRSGGVRSAAKTAAVRLAEVQDAIEKILECGQAFAVSGRRLTRADLAELYRQEERLEVLCRREARGGIRVRRAGPIA